MKTPTQQNTQQENFEFWVKITGENYNGSFPAPFAESLTEMQRGVYKMAALALHGEENIKRLTHEELAKYEIKFAVKAGSTDIETDILDIIEKLITQAFQDMTAEQKIAIIALIAVDYFGYRIFDRWRSSKETLNEQEQHSKQMQILANMSDKYAELAQQVVSGFDKQSQNLEATVLKTAHDADEIVLRGRTYTQEEIKEANRRAERGQMRAEISTGTYRIIACNLRDSNILRFTLSNQRGAEISAALDTESIDADSQELLWQAIKNHFPLILTINKTYAGNTLKSAYIESITTA